MLEAIGRAANQAELRQRFGEEAALAEEDTVDTGRGYDAEEVFAYLESRATGRRHASRGLEHGASQTDFACLRGAGRDLELVAQSDLKHALRTVQRLREAVMLLEHHPLICHCTSARPRTILRCVVKWSGLFYEPS